jgi:hypothetical protein
MWKRDIGLCGMKFGSGNVRRGAGKEYSLLSCCALEGFLGREGGGDTPLGGFCICSVSAMLNSYAIGASYRACIIKLLAIESFLIENLIKSIRAGNAQIPL